MNGTIIVNEPISGQLQVSGTLSGTINIGGGAEPVLDSVTVKSSGVSQTILPEEGIDGFSSVTVSPILLQSKNVTPGSSAQVVVADSGFDGLSSVNVAAAAGGDFVLDFSVSFQGVVQQQEFEGMRNLTGVVFKINNSNLEIGKWGFRNCSGLKSVEIPCCKQIGNRAFGGVVGHDLYLGASEPFGFNVIPITSDIYDLGEPKAIHVPPELVNTYKNDANYSVFADIIVGDYNWPY